MTYLHALERGSLGVQHPLHPAVSGYARGSRVTGEARRVRPDRKWRLMNRFPATRPHRSGRLRASVGASPRRSAVWPTVSTMAFARNHAGRAGGIPATIAIDSGGYDCQRGCEVAAGYARAGGLLRSRRMNAITTPKEYRPAGHAEWRRHHGRRFRDSSDGCPLVQSGN